MVSFVAADYVVGVFVLSVPVVIGIVFAWKDKDKATREEYLVGGRKMSMLPVALSIFITFQSAVSLIGFPSEVYSYGSMYIIFSIGLSLSYVVGIYTYIPVMYPLRLTSVYEYLQLRYDSYAVRLVATFMGMLTTTFLMALVLLSPALALQASAGISLWLSIVLVGGIGTLYTTMGGIKSVIWTDTFQTVIVFIGITAIIVKGCIELGGAQNVWEVAHAGQRTKMDTFDPDPRVRSTYAGCLIGACFIWLANGFNQSTIQRVCSMKSMRDAKKAFIVCIPLVILYGFILVIIGNIVYAYFANSRCDPFMAGYIKNSNQIAPYFVLETMNDLPGMAGLYVSTLCCGSLSTLSSGINALAANTVEDFLRRPLKHVKESTATFVTKMFVLIFGAIIIAIAYGAHYVKGPIIQLATSVIGGFGSPIVGIFILGGSVPFGNKYGAISGAIIALAFNAWVVVGNRLYGSITPPLAPVPIDMCPISGGNGTTFKNITASFLNANHTLLIPGRKERAFGFFLYDVSYEWFSFMGTVVSVGFGILVSALTRSLASGTNNPSLIFPFLRKCWKMDSRGQTALCLKTNVMGEPVEEKNNVRVVE